MSKERPILFTTPMVQATLAGRKTQTRRLRGLKQINSNPDKWKHVCAVKNDPIYHLFEDADGEEIEVKCPFGKPGDTLWVRETWQWEGDTKYTDAFPIGFFFYKADFIGNESAGPSTWKPNIHMPKKACRLRLEITALRVERLNAINKNDAIAEGILKSWIGDQTLYHNYLKPFTEWTKRDYLTPRRSFQTLWESINGPGSWDANPWVWVIEFKPC